MSQSNEDPTAAPALPTKGALVLVVEDNPTVAKLTGRMLTTAGCQVVYAPDGKQGLCMAQTRKPAIVVTDLQMPCMDGLELTRRLKQDPAMAKIPVIMLTAHAMPEHRAAAFEAGCVRFVTKPVRYKELIGEVLSVLTTSSIAVSEPQ